MWDYMIAHFSKDNERAIMRVNEDNVQWLSTNEERTREKKRAKRFFHQDSAESALVILKIRERKGIKKKKEKKPEIKTTWSSS